MVLGGGGDGSFVWPLLLSTLAGAATGVGALLAVARVPDEGGLAFLLGTAIGVMATVSCVELWWHKALQYGWLGITAALAVGGLLFVAVRAVLPEPLEPHSLLAERDDEQAEQPLMVVGNLDSEPRVTVATSVKRQSFAPRQAAGKQAADAANGRRSSSSGSSLPTPASLATALASGSTVAGSGGSTSSTSSGHGHASAGASGSQALAGAGAASSNGVPRVQSTHRIVIGGNAGDADAPGDCCSSGSLTSQQPLSASSGSRVGGPSVQAQLQVLRSHHAGLMRLGLLMALTMTLHNMPEGIAVALSAFTSVGPLMCVAIALHNMPEGFVIAAPIYAATGSRARAVAVATASGLSEPLGALVALYVLRPFVTSLERLDHVLAGVGGVMLAVCGLELWPEARKCRQDGRMAQGVVLGSLLMAWTLYAGV